MLIITPGSSTCFFTQGSHKGPRNWFENIINYSLRNQSIGPCTHLKTQLPKRDVGAFTSCSGRSKKVVTEEFKLVSLDSHLNRFSSFVVVESPMYWKSVKVRQSWHLLKPRLYISVLLLWLAFLVTCRPGKVPGSNILCSSLELATGPPLLVRIEWERKEMRESFLVFFIWNLCGSGGIMFDWLFRWGNTKRKWCRIITL